MYVLLFLVSHILGCTQRDNIFENNLWWNSNGFLCICICLKSRDAVAKQTISVSGYPLRLSLFTLSCDAFRVLFIEFSCLLPIAVDSWLFCALRLISYNSCHRYFTLHVHRLVYTFFALHATFLGPDLHRVLVAGSYIGEAWNQWNLGQA